MTGDVVQASSAAPAVAFEDHGPFEPKGVAGPVRLFRATARTAGL